MTKPAEARDGRTDTSLKSIRRDNKLVCSRRGSLLAQLSWMGCACINQQAAAAAGDSLRVLHRASQAMRFRRRGSLVQHRCRHFSRFHSGVSIRWQCVLPRNPVRVSKIDTREMPPWSGVGSAPPPLLFVPKAQNAADTGRRSSMKIRIVKIKSSLLGPHLASNLPQIRKNQIG